MKDQTNFTKAGIDRVLDALNFGVVFMLQFGPCSLK